MSKRISLLCFVVLMSWMFHVAVSAIPVLNQVKGNDSQLESIGPQGVICRIDRERGQAA